MHPSREELSGYVLGTLPEPAARQVEEHLAECPACEDTIVQLEAGGDTVVERLRQPAPADPLEQEPGCRGMIEVIEAIGREPTFTTTAQAVAVAATGSETPDLGSIGVYKLLAKLGEGGMGTVYKALHTKLDRVVALKVLPAERLKDDTATARFQREMKAVGQLVHPNIVMAHDAGEADGTHFLVMEYVEGLDLSELVRRVGPLPVADACEIIRQAALGLQYAHEHGLVHRDVKPSNLMLGPGVRGQGSGVTGQGSGVRGQGSGVRGQGSGVRGQGSGVRGQGSGVRGQGSAVSEGGPATRGLTPDSCLLTPVVKLLDLGLALFKEQPTPAGELTATGQAMGTADYMAPEQTFDSHQVDIRADIYSLGCTLYKLLTGHAPFSGPKYTTNMAKMLGHVQEPVPPVTDRRADVPVPLVELLDRMLAKDPAERFATPAEAVAALEPLAVGSDLRRLLAEAERAEKTGADADRSVFSTEEYHSSALVGTKPSHESKPRPVTAPHRVSVWKRATEIVRHWPRSVAIAAGLVPLVLALGIVIWINRTRMEVPEGSEIKVGESGSVRITTPGLQGVAGKQPPPLAVAPFNAEQAKQHQQAWADYLGLPVEWENSIGMKFVLIPPGEFMMGSDEREDARPVHRVRITRPFFFGVCEVTQGQYEELTRANPSHFSPNGSGNDQLQDQDTSDLPVEDVTWRDVQQFLARLSGAHDEKVSGRTYRLPTEAEWEYACRGGGTTTWCFGNTDADVGDYAWHVRNSGSTTHPVGEKKPNSWGLYDVHGNVFEWCFDRYDKDYYAKSPTDDPTGPEVGSARVYRGGCWYSHHRSCRSACRLSTTPDAGTLYLGFRVVCEIPDDPAERERFAAPIKGEKQPPPLAVAPFHAEQAKQHQRAWADYLGLPVEWENSVGMKFVLIPPGEFMMGERANEEPPQDETEADNPLHRVRITRPFYCSATEVTQGAYKRVTNTNPSQFSSTKNHENLPVERVSRTDAVEYAGDLSSLSQEASSLRVYRLPTEAEWEYACRAGTTTKFHVGERITMDLANFGQPEGRTAPVASYKANAWGLYDMHGNVFEWCSDWYTEAYYTVSALEDPRGPTAGNWALRRGGGFKSLPQGCASAVRAKDWPSNNKNGEVGFRLLCEIPDDPAERERFAAALRHEQTPGDEAGPESTALEPIEIGPPVKVQLAKIEVRPDPEVAAAIKPGQPLGDLALVTNPASIKGVQSWTIETLGHRGRVLAVAYSPDARLAASGGDDGAVRIWESHTGRLTKVLPWARDRVWSLDWSPDGNRLAVGNHRGVYVCNARSGLIHHRFEAPDNRGRILAVAWSPDGATLATGGCDRVTLRSAVSGELLAEGSVNGDVDSVAWSPDGRILATGGHDKIVRLWEVSSSGLRQLRALEGHDFIVKSIEWSPDGRYIASCGIGEFLARLWNVQTGETVQTYRVLDSAGAVSSIRWSPDGKRLAIGSHARVAIFEVVSGDLVRRIGPESVLSVAWSPDGGSLVLGCSHSLVSMYDVNTGQPKMNVSGYSTLTSGGRDVSFYAWSPDGKLLATHPAIDVRPLRVFDADTGALLATYLQEPADDSLKRAVAWSPDGRIVAFSVGDNEVRLWDRTSGELVGKIALRAAPASVLAWSPDGKILASGESDNTVRVWDVQTKRMTCSLSGHTQPIRCVAWSADNKTLATADDQGTVSVWNASDGTRLATWPTTQELSSLQWSSDGKTLMSGKGSRLTHVWDAASGKLLREIDEPIPGPAGSLKLDLYGRRVALRGLDTNELLWTTWLLGDNGYVTISPEGHWHGSSGVEEELVYAVLTDKGEMAALTPEEFSKEYGWKNDPSKVGLVPDVRTDEPASSTRTSTSSSPMWSTTAAATSCSGCCIPRSRPPWSASTSARGGSGRG